MTRTYDRETKTYDFAELSLLMEAGQAMYYEGPSIWVIKTAEGTVAVRPHQVTFTASPAPFEIKIVSPMDGYHGQEKYDGEDTGPGGVVYDSMLQLAEEWIAACSPISDIDPLTLVRRMLDDEEGEYELAIREQLDDARRAVAAPKRRNGWVSATEANELVAHFS